MASENRQKKTFKFLCEHCGYKTNRKWSFDYHLSRKNPCKPIEIESTVSKDEQNVNPVLKNEKNEQNVNPFERNSFKFEQNINPSNQNYSCDMCKKVFTFKSSLKRHMKTCKGTHDPVQCPICKVVFSSAPAKSRHTKNGKCKPPESDKVEQLEAKIQQLENALTQRDLIKQIEQPVVHNTYNITNNENSMTTNTTNTTTNTTNVINYNNFDSPSLSHIYIIYTCKEEYKPSITSKHTSKHTRNILVNLKGVLYIFGTLLLYSGFQSNKASVCGL